jgi:hypothetical protein
MCEIVNERNEPRRNQGVTLFVSHLHSYISPSSIRSIFQEEECGQGQNRTADTRIFSPAMVPGLCVTIGRQLNESKRLKSLRSRSICRLKHIEANSSGKVVAK